MKYTKSGDTYILRADVGEEVCTCVLELARSEGISLAEISGLGAASSASVGIYDVAQRKYTQVGAAEYPLEAISLTGNITLKDGAPYLHMHALLANPVTGTVLAGHLNEFIVGATAELFIRSLPGSIDRMVCPKTGLNIMKL
ncbi:MAG: DUF296 domain-containing protein [Clostridium sp.]|jgi:predicted DNA-binding protein with PD1-like motif|nr:DUF296 domain-containing protein [Clostridium sp.]